MSSDIKLFTYWRSSSAYRVRIALALKQLQYEAKFVHLAKDEQNLSYRTLNPQGLVPSLQHNGQTFYQSLAIIEYLEETFPKPALLPSDVEGRARVRALAALVANDIQPLNNLRVLKFLKSGLGASKEQIDHWYKHWIEQGFQALEVLLASSQLTGKFCHGNTPTLADICLIPQVYNALRYQCDMTPYPIINSINREALAQAAFAAALPEAQPDADS